MQAAGRVVTLWESSNDREEYGTTAELGTILRQLHQLDAPAELALSPVDPLGRSVRRITTVAGIADEDRAFLLDRANHLGDAFAGLSFDLAPCVIHGDANVGNLLRTRDGRALLMDLDRFAIGPREWDLIQTATFYDRFGWHTEAEYRDFVRTYGYDILRWSGYPVLRDLRELVMVTWLMQNVGSGQEAAAEFQKRMTTLRLREAPDTWSPM